MKKISVPGTVLSKRGSVVKVQLANGRTTRFVSNNWQLAAGERVSKEVLEAFEAVDSVARKYRRRQK